MIGVGAQDDLSYAEEFVATTGVETPDMIWDPSFATWSSFGVGINSQMLLASSDLTSFGSLFFGFGEADRQEILDALPSLR